MYIWIIVTYRTHLPSTCLCRTTVRYRVRHIHVWCCNARPTEYICFKRIINFKIFSELRNPHLLKLLVYGVVLSAWNTTMLRFWLVVGVDYLTTRICATISNRLNTALVYCSPQTTTCCDFVKPSRGCLQIECTTVTVTVETCSCLWIDINVFLGG